LFIERIGKNCSTKAELSRGNRRFPKAI